MCHASRVSCIKEVLTQRRKGTQKSSCNFGINNNFWSVDKNRRFVANKIMCKLYVLIHRHAMNKAAADATLSMIGPHVEVYV